MSNLSDRLADLAVEALIEEVSLTPKPGLVDQNGSGAHTDMDISLLIQSAQSLHRCFYEIAEASKGETISQTLRETIARIGREGEATMLSVTNNVNTHRGAIWILGLMISVVSSLKGAPTDWQKILKSCGMLARFEDRFYTPKTLTKGGLSQHKYGIRSAKGEAMEGFPTLLGSGIPTFIAYQNESRVTQRINTLLALMASLDDTCVIHRGGIEKLIALQQSARKILSLGGVGNPEGRMAYEALCDRCLADHLSPGGSADLLASIIFLESLGVIYGTVKL